MPNGPNVDIGNVNTNTNTLCTFLSQNAMLMEMLKSVNKPISHRTTWRSLRTWISPYQFFTGWQRARKLKIGRVQWTVVANLHRWPDNFKLQSVRANLDGAARNWFISRDIEDWADFESQFRKTFVGVVMTGGCWKEMCRRVQLRNENVREYFHEKVYLCKRVGLSFYESKMQVLEVSEYVFIGPWSSRRRWLLLSEYYWSSMND